MSDNANRSQCPKAAGSYPWPHGPANELHTCPYAAEINDDSESLCECCDRCTQECADDI